MKKITDALRKKKLLISDGAWGTALQERGLKSGECPELWNLTHRDEVLAIAKSYADAGADMIETNSFGGSSIKLGYYNLDNKAFEINKTAAEISREAAGQDIFVIGSIGPTGKFLMTGEVTESDLYESFKEQAEALETGGADACIIETFYDIEEAKSAINAVKENSDLEIICSFTFDKQPEGSFKTMMGISPAEMVAALVKSGVNIIGTNCGNGFENMVEIVKELKEHAADIPILVQANAGIPILKDNELTYPETPDFIADIAPMLFNAGAVIIGGCCGTTPSHIKVLAEFAAEISN